MKKYLAIFMSLVMVFTCSFTNSMSRAENIELPDIDFSDYSDFESLDDPELLQYLEDSIYASLEAEFVDSDVEIAIDDIRAAYVSKEYLEEVAFNTKANIFFGYDLAGLNEYFQGKKYVFTLNDENQTGFQEFLEIPDDAEERFLRNIAIGAGIILVCVTVTIVSAGIASGAAAAAGASALDSISALAAAGTAGSAAAKVSIVFAASAQTAETFALGGAAIAGTSSLIIRGAQTGWDLDAMTHDSLLNTSEGFKYGAITGAVTGGLKGAQYVHTIAGSPLSGQQAEQTALEAYGGRSQVSYWNGEEVVYGGRGTVRPDVICGNEALEVKCYDLTSRSSLVELRRVLQTEISQRIIHLPPEMTQRIVLNVEGRGYSETFVTKIVEWIETFMEPIYPDIPIDIMGEMLQI